MIIFFFLAVTRQIQSCVDNLTGYLIKVPANPVIVVGVGVEC